MGRLISAHTQYDDDDGNPLTGGKVYFYESGLLKAKTTYSDEELTTANSNPVILDAWGRQGDVWFSGKARIRVYSSDDVLIYDIDPVYTSSGSSGGGSGDYSDSDPWRWYDAATSYLQNSLVVSPTTHKWYQSTQDDNLNNSLTNTTYWKEIGPIYIWNTAHTYKTNDFAYYSGLLYRSKTDSNTGNNPITSRTQWEPLGLQYRHQSIGNISDEATQDLSILSYNSYTATLLGDATFTFSDEPPSTEKYVFDMLLDCSALTGNQKPTFPATVKFTRGFEPNWIGICGISFVTYPGDTAWYASEYLIDAKVSAS